MQVLHHLYTPILFSLGRSSWSRVSANKLDSIGNTTDAKSVSKKKKGKIHLSE